MTTGNFYRSSKCLLYFHNGGYIYTIKINFNQENAMIFLIPAIIVFILFYRLYYKQKRPIAGGILMTVFLALFLLGLFGYALMSPLNPVIWVILGIVALVFLMMPLLLLFSSIALMINGQRMVSREGTQVSNLLTLFLGLIILAALILFWAVHS